MRLRRDCRGEACLARSWSNVGAKPDSSVVCGAHELYFVAPSGRGENAGGGGDKIMPNYSEFPNSWASIPCMEIKVMRVQACRARS